MAPGLRERKKRRTRQLIAETARALFCERGFEAVTVAEIARTADVAEKTVFNYFASKEDLVFWGLEAFEEELPAAIRDRPPGEPALAAFVRFVLAHQEPAGDPELARLIESTPALLARERQILARHTDALAAVLAEETGDAAEAWVAANAMMGVHHALVSEARRGGGGEDLRDRAGRAVALLEGGLGSYAIKPG